LRRLAGVSPVYGSQRVVRCWCRRKGWPGGGSGYCAWCRGGRQARASRRPFTGSGRVRGGLVTLRVLRVSLRGWQPLLLELNQYYPLAGHVITADAGHTVKAHARLICERLLAHYAFTVKLYTPALWAELDALDWAKVPRLASEERGHGRWERRTIQVMDGRRAHPRAVPARQRSQPSQGSAAGGLPFLAGDPVHEPVTADLGDRPVLPPANTAEDGAHGMVRPIGARLDELGVRMLEQPVRQQGDRLATVALAAHVAPQANPKVEGSRRE